MGNCLLPALGVAGLIFMMMSMLSWFEHVAQAVRHRWWRRVTTLIVFPFSTWFYPRRVGAGRPGAVRRHEPVRGFGSLPKSPAGAPSVPPAAAIPAPPAASALPASPAPPSHAPSANASASPSRITPPGEGPPPGTPSEFIGLPKVAPRPKSARPPVDPDKLAKLRQKMREQGMLPDEGENPGKKK